MTKAVSELGLEWSPPEEPSCSKLDEWFLPRRQQATRQRSSPFFLKVHDELTKLWRAPYSSRIRPSASSALTSIDGAEKRYELLSGRISARPRLLDGIRGWAIWPSRAEPCLHSLDAPTRRLDKRLRRCTVWLCSRSTRPRCSPVRRTVSMQLHSGTWGARRTWPCAPPKPLPRPSGSRCPAW